MSKNVGSLMNRMTYFSVREPRAARSLVNHLVRTPNDSIILPFAEPGPIISEILSREFKSLTVCEPDPQLRKTFMSTILPKYPNKNVSVHPDDLFDLSYQTHNDVAQRRCTEIVNETRSLINVDPLTTINNCDKQVKLLVPLIKSKYESGLLRSLYYQVVLRLGFFASSWVHYYFLMSDRQHAYLTAKPCENLHLYRSSTVLYNTIFNVRTLESYDLGKCFGIGLRKIQNTAATKNGSYKKVHLVWLEPRLDVINSFGPRSFIEFRFLVTQMMHRRTRLVFSFLERFFDNYRDDVSRLGINESTRSGDLSKEQYYNLYLYLKDREDYEGSTFLQAAAKAEDVFSL